LLEQSVPVTVLNLNQTLRADYYFGGEDGRTRQFNRVQAGELMSDLDSMEDELRRYYNSADESNQIIEGILSPIPLIRKNKSIQAVSIRRGASKTTLFTYKTTESGFLHGEQAWSVSRSMFYAWLFRLDEAGIRTYYTVNYVDTAILLSAVYRNCMKPESEHTTLNRYYRPRIYIKEQDPFIKALMFLSRAYQLDIGEEKAKSLATRYKTLYDINMAEVSELCQCEGIGKTIATKLLKALGREL
jgi:hypothetical protein